MDVAVQPTEVGLDGLGAQIRAQRAAHGGRARRERSVKPSVSSHARGGASRAAQHRRAARGGTRQGSHRRRVPAHDHARGDGGRPAGPAVAQSCRDHQRGAGGRPDRRGSGPHARSFARHGVWARTIARHSHTSSPNVAIASSRGTGKKERLLRDRRRTTRTPGTRSPRAVARSPGQRSASARSGAARPSVASCAHLKLENRKAKVLVTRGDPQRTWGRTAGRFHFTKDDVAESLAAATGSRSERALGDRVEERLTERLPPSRQASSVRSCSSSPLVSCPRARHLRSQRR